MVLVLIAALEFAYLLKDDMNLTEEKKAPLRQFQMEQKKVMVENFLQKESSKVSFLLKMYAILLSFLCTQHCRLFYLYL